MSRLTKRLLFVLFQLAIVTALFAQTFGEITGEVRDATGALVPAVQVTITNTATNASRTGVSNESGIYSFPSLPPGLYNLRAEKAGFKSSTVANIEVQVQAAVRLNLEMSIGAVTETIEVTGAAALLTTENATIGTVVENKRIVELPLNGRN